MQYYSDGFETDGFNIFTNLMNNYRKFHKLCVL